MNCSCAERATVGRTHHPGFPPFVSAPARQDGGAAQAIRGMRGQIMRVSDVGHSVDEEQGEDGKQSSKEMRHVQQHPVGDRRI